VKAMQLIAIDLDGTLVNSQDHISDANITAIRKIQERGIEVTIATGRSYSEVLTLCKEAGISTHVISSNGASVHSRDGCQLSSISIDREDAMLSLQWLDFHRYYYEVTVDDETYTSVYSRQFLQEDIRRIKAANHLGTDQVSLGLEMNKIIRPILMVNRYNELFNRTIACHKIFVFSPDKTRLQAGFNFFEKMQSLNVVSSLDHNIEIISKDTSKGAGLQVLALALGISLDDTMAVGDNYNDVSMFDTAKYSVAMGNAKKEVKALCTYVTMSNDEDGVAHVLDKMIS
jgi:Cof subfamily protein (haloacid dehalogenase superfamily)